MIERREELGFALKSCEAIWILRKRLWQDLQRHVPLQLRVERAINFAHAARAEGGPDYIRAEARTSRQGHAVSQILATEPLTAKKGHPSSRHPALRLPADQAAAISSQAM
jgi:hypothetical protein